MSAVTEIWIDPNVRVAGNQTFAGFEDVHGPRPRLGDHVMVREPESNLVGLGRVTCVDRGDELIYLAVNWGTLVPEETGQVRVTVSWSPFSAGVTMTNPTVGAASPGAALPATASDHRFSTTWEMAPLAVAV